MPSRPFPKPCGAFPTNGLPTSRLSPGAQIRGIGNRLRHEYFRIDDAILWEVLTIDAPSLQLVMQSMLDRHGDNAIDAKDVDIRDSYAGGYGYVRPAKMEAVRLLAETEGLILDPVYTASAMACLIDLCRAGHFKKSDTVVFVNTGGQAGLFPYEAPLRAAIEGRDPPWTVPPWHPETWKG